MDNDDGQPKVIKPTFVPLRTIRWDDGAELRFGHTAWLLLLGLAFRYGWRPQGTEEPDHWEFNPWSRTQAGWSGADYFSSRGQRISESDANALADALDKALPDIPVHDAKGHKSAWRLDLPVGSPVHWTAPDAKVSPIEHFSGPERQMVIDFARRSHVSGFTIS